MSPAPLLSKAGTPASAAPRSGGVASSRWRRLTSRILRTGFALAVLGVAVWAIWQAARDISMAQIMMALAGIPALGLAAALVLTVLSYACLATTEILLVRAMGLRVPVFARP